MLEDPHNSYQVFVGGGGSVSPSDPNWFARLKDRIWPPTASKQRKLLTLGIPLGALVIVAGIVAFLLLSPSKGPLTVATEEVEEGLKIDTDGDGEPDTVIPNDESSENAGGNGGSGGSSSQNGGSGGSSGGTSGGGSSGGSGGGGGSGDSGGGATTSCPLPKYPSASCTGVPVGTSLTTHTGTFSTSSSNQVISGMRITGDVEINHSGVTIRNSEIHGHVKNFSGNGSFTIEDSLIGPPSGCFSDAAVGNNNYTVNRVHLRNFAEGFRVEDDGNVTVRNSFVKFCNPGVDNHADAIQGYLGGSNVIFEHNTVDMRDIPVAADYVTAVIFWSDSSGNNVTFKDNLISGGSYSIRIHVGSGHTVTGNRLINNTWLYGPVSSNCAAISWSDNSIVEIDSNYNITSTVSSQPCVN